MAPRREFKKETHVEVRCFPLPPNGDNQLADQHAIVFKFEASQCHDSNLSNRRIQHGDTIMYSSQPIACLSLLSPTESRDIISRIVTEANILYPFEGLKWYKFENMKQMELDSREDLIGHIMDKFNRITSMYALTSSTEDCRPKLHTMLLRIEKVLISEDIHKQERLDYLNGYVSWLLEGSLCGNLRSMVSSIAQAVLASQPKGNIDRIYEKYLFQTMMDRLARGFEERFMSGDAQITLVPASKSWVESLPKMRFEGCGTKDQRCSICQDDITVGEYVTRLPCDHIYHSDCNVRWLTINHFCPQCRFELPT